MGTSSWHRVGSLIRVASTNAADLSEIPLEEPRGSVATLTMMLRIACDKGRSSQAAIGRESAVRGAVMAW